MKRVRIGKDSSPVSASAPPAKEARAPGQKGVRLGSASTPPATTTQRVTPAAPSRLISKKVLLVAGGAFVLALLAVAFVRLSRDNCQNSVSLDRQVEGDVIKAPTTLHPEISSSHCIRRVSYLLDGVEVGERRFFPFELELSDPALLPAKLGKRDRYELSVVVESAGGKVVSQTKTWWVVFKDASAAAPGGAPGEAPKEPAGASKPGADMDVATLRERSRVFAAAVTRRSDYVFSDEFLALVKKRLPAYAEAYQSAAPHVSKDWRRNINVAFRYFDPPYIGYVLALSRSGFDPAKERGGPWQIPPEAAEKAGLTPGGPKSNGSVADTAARYSRGLLHAFDNDYVLMAAYFGLSIEEAGKRNAEIARMGLGDAERADIKSLSERRVLDEEQINNLADFFAAGVVAFNPREFGADAPTVMELAQ